MSSKNQLFFSLFYPRNRYPWKTFIYLLAVASNRFDFEALEFRSFLQHVTLLMTYQCTLTRDTVHN